jgi:hypothetical protein
MREPDIARRRLESARSNLLRRQEASHNGQFGKSAALATRADCYWGWVTRLRYQPVNLYGPTGARTVTASRTLGDDRGFEETSQVYYNEFAQIRMARWSRGRVVLAGDAAHCASPFTEVEEHESHRISDALVAGERANLGVVPEVV